MNEKRKRPALSPEWKTCRRCGVAFLANRPWQAFHSAECRAQWWNQETVRVSRRLVEKFNRSALE